MQGLTVSEKILSDRCGRSVRAGDIAICGVDLVLGTDGSGPMAIDYFTRMGGAALFDPSRVFFSLDHYEPARNPETLLFHDRIRTFARSHGATVFEVGEGISHQLVIERGIARAGDLVIGADSHTVTCGALNCFAIGVGSSDLAAAMLTGKIWLRVPHTIRVSLVGRRPRSLAAKDIALALVGQLGSDGANYQAIEFAGEALPALPLEDRLVLSNLMVESGAKAAIFPYDDQTRAYRRDRKGDDGMPVAPDPDAHYVRELMCDVSGLSSRVSLPHSPNHVVPLEQAAGITVQMVFIGTCTGGRVVDIHDAIDAFTRAGGRLAPGVQLVVTPASHEVQERLMADGSLETLKRAGAIITIPGCGACCGTSGVIPGDGMTVLSTANRNFKARMGNASAEIYLAAPAVCGAAAATGVIPEQP